MASPAPVLKYGRTSCRLLPGESEQDFQTLAGDCHHRFQPRSAEEEDLVETFIFTTWNIRRYDRLHDEVLAKLVEEEGCTLAEAFLSDCRGARALDKLFRYARDLRRTRDRALKQLLEILQQRPENTIDETKPMPRPATSAPALKSAPPTRPVITGNLALRL